MTKETKESNKGINSHNRTNMQRCSAVMAKRAVRCKRENGDCSMSKRWLGGQKNHASKSVRLLALKSPA